MANEKNGSAQRERSPAYPIIPLGAALGRLAEFEAHFKRSPARPDAVGKAWNVSAKAYASRIAAALRYFGFLSYEQSENGRQIVLSDDGRRYLRAQQDSVKQEVVKRAALKPMQIAKFWNEWGANRPADAACLDELVLKNAFSEAGAKEFVKVYDSTIAYAGLSDSDKSYETEDEFDHSEGDDSSSGEGDEDTRQPSGGEKHKVKMAPGERELTTGLLARDSSFRLLVSGKIGPKEIDRLIAKLALDKEILAESDEGIQEGDE